MAANSSHASASAAAGKLAPSYATVRAPVPYLYFLNQQPQQVQTPETQQQQQQQQQSQNLSGIAYDESGSGDDGIVPSTPTLYVPRRADGFSEAVSSPHLQVTARFTYDSGARATNSEGIDDTRVDLTQLDESGSSGVPVVPPSVILTEPDAAGPSGTATTSPSIVQAEPIPGTSASEASVPDIVIDDEGGN